MLESQGTGSIPPGGDGSAKTIWVYGYELLPPQHRDRLGRVSELLDDAHVAAGLTAETWGGRLVNGDEVTHILVVSDSPDRTREVNRQLEVELRNLGACFTLTIPLAVPAHHRA